MPIIPGPNEKFPGTNWVKCENGDCVKHDSQKDPLKKHCIPKSSDKCEPNDPEKRHKCHCRALKWIRDKKNPGKGHWDDMGPDDFKDDDDIYCFCVREPQHGRE